MMTATERNELGLHLNNLAMYYGRQINPGVITMLLDDLKYFSYAEILVAIKKYRQAANSNRFPLPNDLIKIINPIVDNKSQAIEAASRIVEAVGTFGWPNQTAARDYIGELGWRVVERIGGWQYICENLGTELNLGTFTAQARDLANATLERVAAGRDGTAPQLQQGAPKELTSLLSGNDLNLALNEGNAKRNTEPEKSNF